VDSLYRWLPLIIGISAIVYAVCCSNSASDFAVSGYADACITCNWEGDGVVYLEKWNPYFICPLGEYYGYKIFDRNGIGCSGTAPMGQSRYCYIPLASGYVAAGVTWQGCTSTRPSVTVFCDGTCAR